MVPYVSKSGKKSGVVAFEIGFDFIAVKFDAGLYVYSLASCGKIHLENMKALAVKQNGLNRYIIDNQPPFIEKF